MTAINKNIIYLIKKYKVFGISLVIGLLFLMIVPDYIDMIHSDTKIYIEQSEGSANVYSISPGYPLIIRLSKITNNFYLFLTLFHVLLFAIIMQMIYFIKRNYYTLILIIISGAYIIYIPYVLSDLTFSFFVICSYYYLRKNNLVLHVVFLLISSLIRPTLAYFFIIEPFIIWFQYKNIKLSIKMFVIVFLLTSIVPFRNLILFDRFIHTNSLEWQYDHYMIKANSKIMYLAYCYIANAVSTHYFNVFNIFGYYKSNLVYLKPSEFLKYLHYFFILFYGIIYVLFLRRSIKNKNYVDLLWVFYFQSSACMALNGGRVRLPYEFLIY